MARGDVTMCQNWTPLRPDAFTNVAPSGTSTRRLRYVTVYPNVSPNPGRMLCFFNRNAIGSYPLTKSAICLVNLIEYSSVVEINVLGLLPPAKHFINGHEFQLGKNASILFCNFRMPRAVIISRDNLLTFGRIEKLKICLSRFAGALLVYDFVNDRYWRLGQNALGWNDNLDFV